MNKYATDICIGFRRNAPKIHATLGAEFKSQRVNAYLNEYLLHSMSTFERQITKELQVSDPLIGVTTADQIASFTNQFILETSQFISAHVVGEEKLAEYVVGDGYRTGVSKPSHYQKSASTILESWRKAPNKSVHLRDDSGGDVISGYRSGFAPDSDHNMMTGVTFCDQSHLGTSNHVEMYGNTLYKNHLN